MMKRRLPGGNKRKHPKRNLMHMVKDDTKELGLRVIKVEIRRIEDSQSSGRKKAERRKTFTFSLA